MAFYGVEDALRAAQAAVDGGYVPAKGPGLLPPPPPPQDGISLWSDFKKSSGLVPKAQPPRPGPSNRRPTGVSSYDRTMKVWDATKAAVEKSDREEAVRRAPKTGSPLHDKQRAKPGTLERNMALLDQQLGKYPAYQEKRDAIKYRLQDMMVNRPADGQQPILQDEAMNAALEVAGALKDPSYAGTPVNPNEVRNIAPHDPPVEGESLWEAIARLGAEEEDLSRARTSDFDRTLQIMRTIRTPDYSDKIGPDAGGFLQGIMSIPNVPENLAGAYDLATVLGDVNTKVDADTLLGKTPEEKRKGLFRLAGGVLGSLGLGAVTGGAMARIKGRGKVPAPDVPAIVADADVAPVPAVPVTDPPAPSTTAPLKTKGRRPLLDEAVTENIGVERLESAVEPVPQKAVKGKTPSVKVEAPTEPVLVGATPEPVAKTRPAPTATAPAQPGVETMKVDDVDVHRDLQYKVSEVADPKNKVGNQFKDVDVYDRAKGGIWTVWEDASGKRYALNSHHRRELAQRATRFADSSLKPGEMVDVPREVPVRVLKETDGWTVERARAYGALENIADGKGNAFDAVGALRDAGIDADTYKGFFKSEGVSLKKTLVRNIDGLLKLPKDAMSYLRTRALAEEFVAGVGSVDGLSASEQRLVLESANARARAGDAPTTYAAGEQMARRARGKAMQLETDDGLFGGGLFGEDADFSSTLANLDKEALIITTIKRRMASARSDLLKIPDEILEGEVLNRSARQEKAGQLGGSTAEVKDRVDFLFEQDRGLSSTLDGLAREVVNGTKTIGQATDELFPAVTERAAGDLRQYIRGADAPDATVPGKRVGDAEGGQAGFGRESGKADLKVLGAAATVGAAGVALVANGQVKEWVDYVAKHGVPREAVVGLGIAASAGAVVMAARNGRVINPETMFKLAKGTLDPRTIAERAAKGNTKATRLMGEALLAVTDAANRHTVATAKSLRDVHEIATEHFGKKFYADQEFSQADVTVRDRMEQNIADGKDWHDGLSAKERGFVERIRAEVLDPILNRWEQIGGRIAVSNDGTQHGKLEPGANVRLQDGRYGKYEGFERATPDGDPSDPFSKNGGFGKDESNLARDGASGKAFESKAHVERTPRVPPDGAVDLIVKMDDGSTVRIRPGERFGRPVDRIGDGFVPRIFSKSFLERLKGQRTQEFNAALAKMLEEQNAHLGLSGDEMMGRLGDVATATENTGRDVASFMANLEKERMFDLAKFEYIDAKGKTVVVDPYESSYLTSVMSYVDRGWKRVAIAEEVGVDPHALGSILRGLKAADGEYGLYLENVLGQALRLGDQVPKADGAAALARAEGAWQTLTKLTGGTTQVAQLGDLVFPVSEAGFVPVAKAVFKTLVDKTAREEASLLAAADQNWLGDLRRGDMDAVPKTPGQKLVKGTRLALTRGKHAEGMSLLADSVMGALGIRWLDTRVKAATVIAATEDVGKALRAAAEARKAGKAVPAAITRKLQRYGVADQIEAAATHGVDAVLSDEGVQATFAGSVRRSMMYTGDAIDNPMWLSTPLGSAAARFKKPVYVTTRFLLRNVVSEAAQGNLAPLARFVAVGVGGGTAATYVKDLMRFEGFDSETRRLIGKGDWQGVVDRVFGKPGSSTLMNPANRQGMAKLLFTAGKGIYDIGGMGMAGEFIPAYNRRVQDLTGNYAPDLGQALLPASLESLRNVTYRVLGKKSDIKDENLLQWRTGVQEAIESEVLPIRRLTSALGLQSPLTEVNNIERKLRKGERLTQAEVTTLAETGTKVKGRFNTIRKIQKGTNPPKTYSDRVYETIGKNRDLTPVQKGAGGR